MDYSLNKYDCEIFTHDGFVYAAYNHTMKTIIEFIGKYNNIDSVYIVTSDPYNKLKMEIESDEI